jgi:hypothetical protein
VIHVPVSPRAGGYDISGEDEMNLLNLDGEFRLLASVVRVLRQRQNDIRPLIFRVMDAVDLPRPNLSVQLAAFQSLFPISVILICNAHSCLYHYQRARANTRSESNTEYSVRVFGADFECTTF